MLTWIRVAAITGVSGNREAKLIIDALTLEDGQALDADVCIVGAGAAGMTLAMELSGNGLDVIVLESGGFEFETEVNDMNVGTDLGSGWGNTGCRARYLGGSTNLWVGWCRPLDPEDFVQRDWIGDIEWPIRRDDLDPFYARARRTLQIGADDFDADAAAERLGFDLIQLDRDRVETVLYQFSPPTRFGRVYRSTVEDADDVRLYLHATVVNIATDGAGERVERLDVATLEGGRHTVTAERFVLAMGGIENARVLMASRDTSEDGVANSSGLVGRYFMEHPHFTHHYLLTDPSADGSIYSDMHPTLTFDAETPDGIEVRVRGALSIPRSVQESEGLPSCAMTFRPIELDQDTGDLDAAKVAALLPAGAESAQLWRVWVRAEQRPNPDSRILLDEDDVDALGIPRVIVDWRVSDRDMADYRRILERIGAELGRESAGRMYIPLDGDGVISDWLEGGCHHMSTTRMHADPTQGVVDADCKAHDLDNLYIAGSSVFPTGGFANPTMTIVALAHRLADHLVELSA